MSIFDYDEYFEMYLDLCEAFKRGEDCDEDRCLLAVEIFEKFGVSVSLDADEMIKKYR